MDDLQTGKWRRFDFKCVVLFYLITFSNMFLVKGNMFLENGNMFFRKW